MLFLFTLQTMPCVKEPCSINGAFQPEINVNNSEFYGFSEFYYSMEDVLRIAGQYDYKKFEQAAQVLAKKPTSSIQYYQDDNSIIKHLVNSRSTSYCKRDRSYIFKSQENERFFARCESYCKRDRSYIPVY